MKIVKHYWFVAIALITMGQRNNLRDFIFKHII